MTRISDSHSLMTHEKQGSVEENKRKNSGGCSQFGQSTWASFQPYHYFLFYGIDEGLNLICNFYYVVL